MSSVAFWNRVHSQGTAHWEYGVELPKEDDPVLHAALAHFGDVSGKRLIDLGCGSGAASLFFAARGAEVIAVDTSDQAVLNLQRYCAAGGIENVHPMTADAFRLTDVGPADLVYGSMILHHLEPFAKFVDVLRETIVPKGRAFFYENSSVSRLLIWFRTHLVGRWWIPKNGDDEEFPLAPQEIDVLRKQFAVRTEYPELLFFRLISMYLLRGKYPKPFAALDRWGYRIPWLRKLSYRQYVYLSS